MRRLASPAPLCWGNGYSTKVELAMRARRDQADISRIEKGAKAISLDVLDRLCRALECEPGDILVRTRR